MAEENYWVRTEQGRVWGPFPLAALERLRGQLTEKAEASLDGKNWKPGSEFPELRDLLTLARKVEKQRQAGPRISAALAQAFGLGTDLVSAPAGTEPEPPRPVQVSQPSPIQPASQASQAPVDKPLELPESGDLAALSPLRLYALAALTSSSGWLQLELDKGRMLQISFRRGTPEHLSCDDPDLSVLRFLQQKGVVSAEKSLAAEEKASKSGQDLVSVMFQEGLIPPSEAHQLLGDYARFLLDRALLCWRGKFSFEKEAPSPPGAFPLGQRWTLLAEAVRRLDLTVLRARLGKRLLRPVVRSGGLGIGKVEELALNSQETRLYAGLDGTRTGEELIKQSDPALVVRLLYLLTELGHLGFAEQPDEAPVAPPAAAGAGEAAVKPAAGLPQNAERAVSVLPKIARQAGREGSGPRTSQPPVMKGTAKAKDQPQPSKAPPMLQPSAAPAAPPQQITRPVPTFAQPPGNEAPAAAVTRLTALLKRLTGSDHFEALGVERKTASAAEAKRNFFVLARELHPDTVVGPEQTVLRDLKERLFSRINEAAEVLTDDKRRKEYEQELDGKASSVDVARIFAAEEHFQRAEIFIKARKYQEGLELLDKAIAMNAEEAEFFAWRGYARFLLSRDRKEAYEATAADCRKAIKMQDKCVPAHLFLGHMSKMVGDTKLAQRCYERVLQIEPKHTEAQRELRLMGRKG